jgi:GNAT superfamily N-acetyltransferase
MTAIKKLPPARPRERLRIEPVDNWHARWPSILAALKRQGAGRKLRIDSDGWLSARQVVLVAFSGETVAGHLCFSVAPARRGCVEARLNSRGVDPAFAGSGIEVALYDAAVRKAQSLKCSRLTGFQPVRNSK